MHQGSAASRLGDHIPALDGLRGIAILFVMLFHYVTACDFGSDAYVTRKILGVAVNMWAGVDLFFVLSGFLITGILLRAKDKPGYFTNFYMRRCLRIFPLYYGALIILFVIVPRFVPVDTADVKRIYDSQGWLWAYSEDFAIAFHNEDYFDVSWLWVGHFWSLGVEEHFYLVWPLLVFACSGRKLLWATIAFAASAPLVRVAMLAHGMAPHAVYTLTFCRTDELAIGGLVAILARERTYESLARLARGGILIATVYFVSVVLIRQKPQWWGHWTTLGPGFSLLGVGFAGAVVLAISPERTWIRRVLESRPLIGFGKYSYGAYVIHTPMQPVYLKLFPPRRIAEMASGLGHSGSRVVGLLGFASIGIAITMLLAIGSFFAYERPFLKLKRHFEYGSVRGATVAASPSPESS